MMKRDGSVVGWFALKDQVHRLHRQGGADAHPSKASASLVDTSKHLRVREDNDTVITDANGNQIMVETHDAMTNEPWQKLARW